MAFDPDAYLAKPVPFDPDAYLSGSRDTAVAATSPGAAAMSELTAGDRYTIAGARPAPVTVEAGEPISAHGRLGAIEAGLAAGATMGGLANFAGLAAAAGSAGKGYKDKLSVAGAEADKVREIQKQASDAHPWLYGGAEMVGGAPLAAVPGGLIAKGATLAARAGIGAGLGAGLGATTGFLGSEFSSPSETGVKTLVGGAVGAAAGAAGQVVAEGLGAGWKKAADWLAKRGQAHLDEKVINATVGGKAAQESLFAGADPTARRASVLEALRSVPEAERLALGGKFAEVTAAIAKASEDAAAGIAKATEGKVASNADLIAKIEKDVIGKFSGPTQRREREAAQKVVDELRSRYGISPEETAARADAEILDRIATGASKRDKKALFEVSRADLASAPEMADLKADAVLSRAKSIPGLADDLLAGDRASAASKAIGATNAKGREIGEATDLLDSWFKGPTGKQYADALRGVAGKSPIEGVDTGAAAIHKAAYAIEAKYGDTPMTFAEARRVKSMLQERWSPETGGDQVLSARIKADAATAAKNVFLDAVDAAKKDPWMSLLKSPEMKNHAGDLPKIESAIDGMRQLHQEYGELKALETAIRRNLAPEAPAGLPPLSEAGQIPLADVMSMTEAKNPGVATAAREFAYEGRPELKAQVERAKALADLKAAAEKRAASGAPAEPKGGISKLTLGAAMFGGPWGAAAAHAAGWAAKRSSVDIARLASTVRAGGDVSAAVAEAVAAGVPRETAAQVAHYSSGLFARPAMAAPSTDQNQPQNTGPTTP